MCIGIDHRVQREKVAIRKCRRLFSQTLNGLTSAYQAPIECTSDGFGRYIFKCIGANEVRLEASFGIG